MAESPRNVQFVEGELIGNVYEDSVKSTATDLYFELTAFDPATDALLSGTSFSSIQWLDPTHPFSISYIDPQAGGQDGTGTGPACGGSYVNFLNDDLAGTMVEQHAAGPTAGDPSGVETHCIIPGQYRVRLRRGSPQGTVLRDFRVDYLASESKDATIGGGQTAWIEAPAFDPAVTLGFGDLVLNFDLGPSDGFSDTQTLQIENAESNPYKGTFSNHGSPEGTVTDWFRFRTDESSSTWNLTNRGTVLYRIWWDGDDPLDASGFYDHGERPVLRIRHYEDLVTPPATVVAGLDVMRPDEEEPASAPDVTRTISIIEDTQPTACFDVEGSSTWRNVDQFFDASCSSGTDLEYSWDVGPGFGPYTDEPVIEFFGHSTGGTKPIKLRVRDVAHSPATTDDTTISISVGSSVLSLSGPAYVTDKLTKTYTASTSLNGWYERYDPDTLTTWYFILTGGSTYNRIWPAGEYTRGLRAESPHQSSLRRGRIDVEVCHQSIPGCGQAQFVASGSGFGWSAPSGSASDLFGLGPWIHTGEEVVRFYDLTGLHEPDSPFADVAWLDQPTGSAKDAGGRMAVDWKQVDSDDPDIRVIEFAVTPSTGRSHRFGMAIDPDLGSSPADDRSGFDADRGLAYAFDGGGALGFLLEGEAQRKIAGVDQYGTRRFAPRAATGALEAGRSDGVRLIDGEDDVQFVLSAGATSGPSTWRLVVLRAASVRVLRGKADAYLGR